MEKDRSTHNTPAASTHRLPTISASQALQNLDQGKGKWIPTGLSKLDLALKGPSLVVLPSQNHAAGGFSRGQVTEIYGPPGAGKTALGLQTAVRALYQGSHVAWIDANKPLYGPRLASFLPIQASKDVLQNFHHYTTPSLPHLLALFCHPPPAFPPVGTTVLIIDGLSALFTQTYPDNAAASLRSRKKTSDEAWAISQRYAVMADLLAKLTKLAAIRDLAIVLLSHTSIKVNTELGAVLRPAIWTKTWTEGVPNRIIVFRDFFRTTTTGERRSNVRFAGVTKLNGVVRNRLGIAVAFQIQNNGCVPIESSEALPAPTVIPVNNRPLRKRKREQDEVADSQSDFSDDDLLYLLDRGLDDDEDTTEMQTSFAEAREFEYDLAAFETAIEDGLDEV